MRFAIYGHYPPMPLYLGKVKTVHFSSNVSGQLDVLVSKNEIYLMMHAIPTVPIPKKFIPKPKPKRKRKISKIKLLRELSKK